MDISSLSRHLRRAEDVSAVLGPVNDVVSKMEAALNQANRDLIHLDDQAERYRITQVLIDILALEIKTHQQAIAELRRVKSPASDSGGRGVEPEDLPDPAQVTPAKFEAAFKKWMDHVERLWQRSGPNMNYKLGMDRAGSKFIRVWQTSHGLNQVGGKSAVAFIDKATGDVYKPDGWKKPARGIRGNIFTPTNYGVGPTGFVHYLR